MAKLEIPMEYPTRLCVVNGEVGYFHLWERYSESLPPSPMIGGEPAGIFSKVFGIVEFRDSVRRVDPVDIRFRDDTTDCLNYIYRHEDIKERILKGLSKYSENQGEN